MSLSDIKLEHEFTLILMRNAFKLLMENEKPETSKKAIKKNREEILRMFIEKVNSWSIDSQMTYRDRFVFMEDLKKYGKETTLQSSPNEIYYKLGERTLNG